MRIAFLLVLLSACSSAPRPAPSGEVFVGNALDVLAKNRIAADQPVKVIPLYENPDHTTLLIQVNTRMRAHFHSDHDEWVYLLEGGGTFRVAGHPHEVKPGDVMVIPRGAIHSFENKAAGATAVVSVISPRFDGKDRRYVDE